MNKYLKSTSIAALATILSLSAPAQATDLNLGDPTASNYSPSRSWEGPYVGIFGGYGWADRQTSLNDAFNAKVFDPGHADIDGEGWLGGVAVGYNAQRGSIVFGLEADVAMTGIEGDTLVGTTKYDATDGKDGTAWGIGYEVEYLGTLRGRLGFLVNPSLLVYGTGGAAWALVDESHTVQDGQNPIHAKSSTKVDHFGWTAGGGLEWEFKPGWTFKTEYLYVDLGEADYNHYVGNKSGAPDVTSSDLDMHIAKAGINVRF